MDGVHNDYDSGVPIAFAMQSLAAHTGIMEVYEGKIFETVNISKTRGDNYLLVASNQESIVGGGCPESITGIFQTLKVINVRQYPTGQGSEMDFSSTLKMLRRALCGKPAVVIYNSERIGEVDEAIYIGEIPLHREPNGNFDLLQKGIRVRLLYR